MRIHKYMTGVIGITSFHGTGLADILEQHQFCHFFSVIIKLVQYSSGSQETLPPRDQQDGSSACWKVETVLLKEFCTGALDSIAVSLFGWSKQIQFKSSPNRETAAATPPTLMRNFQQASTPSKVLESGVS